MAVGCWALRYNLTECVTATPDGTKTRRTTSFAWPVTHPREPVALATTVRGDGADSFSALLASGALKVTRYAAW